MSAVLVSVKVVLLLGIVLAALTVGAMLLGFGTVEASETGCVGEIPQSCVFTIL